MAVTNYHSVGGVILGESAGGVRTDYAPNALGSVAATVDQTSAVVNQYCYKPYGSQLSKTGVGADPAFRWVGALGYRQTGRSRSEGYVRARHYDQKGGRWTSVDPLWPEESDYGYLGGSPIVETDPSGANQQGEIPHISCDCSYPSKVHGIAKSDPHYKCVKAACDSYGRMCLRIGEIRKDMCVGDGLSDTERIGLCKRSIAKLPLCDADDPDFPTCDQQDTGGVLFFACCMQCLQRACCLEQRLLRDIKVQLRCRVHRCYGRKIHCPR